MPATFDTQPIAHYELEDVISKTSTSTVYLAQQTQLKRTVCVKVVAPSLASQPVFRERFLAEATLLAGLSHPHIVTIYEVGETDGTLFISLEHIDGGDIGRAIRDGIDAPTALRIVRDVALALQFAHEHRFVHGDIRPANILMTAAGRVVLTDFCIAKVLRHSGIVTTAGQSRQLIIGLICIRWVLSCSLCLQDSSLSQARPRPLRGNNMLAGSRNYRKHRSGISH
jgi:serine/threonine protein kinase